MRILLDENLDWRLKRELTDHEVESVQLNGWAGTKNGRLLRKAEEAGSDVFVTMDVGISQQQNIALSPLAVIVLRAGSNRLADVRPLISQVQEALVQIAPGTVTILDSR